MIPDRINPRSPEEHRIWRQRIICNLYNTRERVAKLRRDVDALRQELAIYEARALGDLVATLRRVIERKEAALVRNEARIVKLEGLKATLPVLPR